MSEKKKNPNTELLAQLIIKGIQEKKGDDIVKLDLCNIHESLADYFIICHANSSTQVKAIADSVEEFVWKNNQELPLRKEGITHGEWILIDYADIVVHVFKTEKRAFYALEELWRDAEAQYYQSA